MQSAVILAKTLNFFIEQQDTVNGSLPGIKHRKRSLEHDVNDSTPSHQAAKPSRNKAECLEGAPRLLQAPGKLARFNYSSGSHL